MILSVGEILVDMIGVENSFTMYVGGAPFNVAVNAKRAGAPVSFLGKVGDDVAGRFLLDKIPQFNLDNPIILVDKKRNTTLAFVSHNKDGDRDFTFFRRDTADFQLSMKELDFDKVAPLKILNVGTLMLSEKKGRKFAKSLVEEGKKIGAKIAIDGNFRDDLYQNREERNSVLREFLLQADILKLSLDELLDFQNASSFEEAIDTIPFEKIIFITDGAKGSWVVVNKEYVFTSSHPVKAVDTTGAGDAYFGTALAYIHKLIEEEKPLTLENLQEVAKFANEAGSKAVLKKGAL